MAVGLFVAALVLAYWTVLAGLVGAWSTDDNYSHGFFIVPLAAYFAWERRARVRRGAAATVAGSDWSSSPAACACSSAGLLGAELFLSRVSLIGALAGAILFLFGWQRLRVLLFPLAFLLLMIPLPAIIFNKIAFPLQLLASQSANATINALEHSHPARRQRPDPRQRHARSRRSLQRHPLAGLAVHARHRVRLFRRSAAVGARGDRAVGDSGRDPGQRACAWPAPAWPRTITARPASKASFTNSPAGSSSSSRS